VFVVGMPRSGTTLIQGILCNTGYYFPVPETHFFSRVGYGLPEQLDEKNRKKIQHLLKKKARIEVDEEIICSLESQKEIFEYIIDIFNEENKNTFLEKTPRHVFFYSKILHYYPTAKFICMIREPKNVVSSQKTRTKIERKSITRLALLYNKIAAAIIQIKNENNVFLVRYEDLTSETEKVVHNLWQFLDIPFGGQGVPDIAAPEKIVQEHEFWKRKNIELNEIVRNDPDKWQAALTVDQAHLVSSITRNYARQFGYDVRPSYILACGGLLRDIPNLFSQRERKRLFSKLHG